MPRQQKAEAHGAAEVVNRLANDPDLGPVMMPEIERLRDLIKWLAPRIERVNGSGTGASRNWCILCALGPPALRKPCRHAEIFEIYDKDRSENDHPR
jgi:hypothetical protein